MEKTRTYSIHPAAFIYQAAAAPHQSFLSIGSEVPIAKKSSFLILEWLPLAIIILKDSLRFATPSGEAKGKKPYALTIHPAAQFRALRADAIRPYGYAAYHCGNLQVSFLKLHLFGNGAGESKIGGESGKTLAMETSPYLKEMFTPYGIMISRQKLLWKSTKQKEAKKERMWKMQKRMKISWKIQQRVDFRECLW